MFSTTKGAPSQFNPSNDTNYIMRLNMDSPLHKREFIHFSFSMRPIY